MAKKTSAKPAVKRAAASKAARSAKPKSAAAKALKAARGSSRTRTAVAPAEPRLKKSPLGRKDLLEFRRLLLEKRRQLLGDMSGMEAEAFRAKGEDGSGDLSTMPVHMADIGTDNYEQEFTLGLLESERRLLRDIDEALDRIERGIYGVCVGTGQAIAVARLRAKPWAKYCIEYARKLEQGLAQRPVSVSDQAGGEDEGDSGDEDLDEAEEEVEAPAEAEDGPAEDDDDIA